MHNLPTITILTGTSNSNVPLFKKVLESVRTQNYPKNLLEHIVTDKGSINGCVEMAKKYGCKVVIRKNEPEEKQQESAAIGIKMAQGEMVLFLESDNILSSKGWLRKMIQPFMGEKKVVCTFSAYNSYEKNMSTTTRCTALFGAPDPTLYYLNKTEKIRMDQRTYNKGVIIKETDDFYIVKFTRYNLPTLGDNGHMFLKRAMVKVITSPDEYIHVDAFSKLFSLGYDTFGVVKNSIIHVQNPNVIDLVKRRVEIKKIYYDNKRGKRKYLVFNPSNKDDLKNLVLYVLFSLTLLVPLFESVRGYLRIRDKAWFLHPVLCFLMVVAYGWSEIRFQVNRLFKLT